MRVMESCKTLNGKQLELQAYLLKEGYYSGNLINYYTSWCKCVSILYVHMRLFVMYTFIYKCYDFGLDILFTNCRTNVKFVW